MTREMLRVALEAVAKGRVVPYLGPEVAALGGAIASPAALCAEIESQVRVPKRAHGNLWAAAQFVETRKFRATVEKMVIGAFSAPTGPNPIHDWIAATRPPMVVDAWYDPALVKRLRAGSPDWGLVQGVSRNGEWAEIWHRSYAADGTPRPEGADPAWPMLLYMPHGLALPGHSFLVSDSDYVEVLTEIDIQSPIPDEVRNRRTGRGFLFLGCRFDDQLLRTYARQIAKRSGEGHVAVIEGELTRMERLFLEEIGIERIDVPLAAVVEELKALDVSAG
ncbi:SIR2 family protein [Cereibacter sphaeroides]|uniref:SIR2 family NAD-dependent protein deacylase n=1 Tax=Cereibacter sphaeroides TaxID=1063 RepID=UPI001F3B0757|nr:SIR2 family protein [Cereibacter sphaeroides]MCE6958211.1 SIR2 family protein [Cereibacter sphaeroides]MCE6972501.1 SIR2 family protein [Cereibacter sphaeroides]